MGHKFSLVLSREITEEETKTLTESGCPGGVFGPDTLPTNAEIAVTRVDVDTTEAASLAEAIQAGLDAVTKVPDLTAASLSVPAQPAKAEPSQDEGAEAKTETKAETKAAPKTRAKASATKDTEAKDTEAKTPAKKQPAKKAPAKRTRKAPATDKELAETGAK